MHEFLANFFLARKIVPAASTPLAAAARRLLTCNGSRAEARGCPHTLDKMNTSQGVDAQINGVEFGLFSADDIRTLSVKRITNPTTFDSLLHPVPGGLHDPSLGAFLDNPCSTCGLTTLLGCPGHCGHIELPIPVYHLTFLDQLLRLLRGKCGYCHRFKLSRVQINEYVSKLRLIRCGLVQEANDMHEHIDLAGAKNKKNIDREESESDEDGDGIIGQRNEYVKKVMRRAGISKSSVHTMKLKTETISDARRHAIKEFLAETTKGRKCANCGGINPTYRKDRAIKIFRKNLNGKDKVKMAQVDKRIQNPLEILAKREARANKKEPHADEGVADLDPATSEDEDVELLDAQEADGNFVDAAALTARREKDKEGPAENSQDYLTTAEVRAALILLFETEPDILRLMYSPYSRSKSRSEVSPDMFFMHAVIVPPNRYRMEDRTGDSIAESPKNSLYKGILNACDSIRQISNEMKGQENEAGYRSRDFGDLQTAWVNLQGAVNALVDRDANPIQGLAGRSNADGVYM